MASSRSRPLPCGMPSSTSMSTTLPSSFDATQWAAVAPTLPAPTIVIFFRIQVLSFSAFVRLDGRHPVVEHHVVDDVVGKLAGADLGCARHLPLEVVGDQLIQNGGLHGIFDQARRLRPAQVVEHHHPGENYRTRID